MAPPTERQGIVSTQPSTADAEWEFAASFFDAVLDDTAWESTGEEMVAKLRARGFRAPSETAALDVTA